MTSEFQTFRIMLLVLASCLSGGFAHAAPAPEKPMPPQGGETGLSLVLSAPTQKCERNHSVVLSLVLVNHEKNARALEAISTQMNAIARSRDIEFVFRFADGTLGIAGNPMLGPAPRHLKCHPLVVPADGEAGGEFDLRNIFSTYGHLESALQDNRPFSVTVIVKALKLKSNPLYFNGFKEPEGGSDPFADYEVYEAKVKAEAAYLRWLMKRMVELERLKDSLPPPRKDE
jgi:hypothetical protein